MSAADYYADCGNTCSKILDPRMHTVQRLEDEELRRWVADHAMPGMRIVVLPGNRERAEHLRQLASAQQARIELLPEQINPPDCGQYDGMGLDRLCSGLAAIASMEQDCIVVDAGTMLTFGAWRYQPDSDFQCRFAGGFIAPGPQACLDAMHQAAPALPQLTFSDAGAPVGTDTESHMQAAIAHGWPALCASLLQQVQSQLPEARIVACGGFHQQLPFDVDWHNPALVLHGMQLLLEQTSV